MPRKIRDDFFIELGKYYDSNIYIFLNENNEVLLIDCGSGDFTNHPENALWEIGLRKKDVKKIILTHKHYDHYGACRKFPWAEILAGEKDSSSIESGDKSTFYHLFSEQPVKIKVNKKLKENDTIFWGNYEFQVIETPGHTQGSISLLEKNNKWIFTGDALFGDGNLPNFEFSESIPDIFNSVEKILSLDWKTLYPGHGLEGEKESILDFTKLIVKRLKEIYFHKIFK